MPKNKLRLDDYLVNAGFFDNKDQVLRCALAKEIRVDTTYVSSAATQIEIDEQGIAKPEIFIKNQKQFVSRGGLKLQRALDIWDIDVTDKTCLDIGSSTGGFTDCLLQAKAASVACVDVNYGQLAWRIRNNPKVEVFERLNIKEAKADELGAPFDIIVTDVSFISLASISKVVSSFSTQGSIFIGLIKPQFECRKGETVNGIVQDENIRNRTIREVKNAYEDAGFNVVGTDTSPIKGHAGNTEFLIYCIKN